MRPKSSTRLTIEISAAVWKRVSGLNARLQKAAVLTLASLPKPLTFAAAQGAVTLLLTTDAEVRKLNHDWRGKNKPTNVLSFPYFTRCELQKVRGGIDFPYVGDIAVAYQFTAAEAKAEGKKLIDHLTHLMVHGLLHLFGFDHVTPALARTMEKLEKQIMAELGLPDPYVTLAPKPKKRAKRAKKK